MWIGCLVGGWALGGAAAAPGDAALPDASAVPAVIRHALDVQVEPAAHRLRVRDRFELPAPAAGERPGFLLHPALRVEEISLGGHPTAVIDAAGRDRRDAGEGGPDGAAGDTPDGVEPRFLEVRVPFDVTLPAAAEVVYGGVIHDPLAAPARDYARAFATTSGLVDSAGVFLSGATTWVPWIESALVTFEMRVSLPDGFLSVSQGVRAGADNPETWVCDHPQEEIYLVAGRYHLTERRHGGVSMQTYLDADDPELSGRYLEATAGYLDMYGTLLGPYPYGKFALVENFWQTGYGMPSFTLLGDQVIRMPWIIATSYGHEILHNWFGNGVYVVWEAGNWCEGLTTYLADHLYKEQQGQGADYRRGTLRAYRDYVREANDFALTEFRSRFDPVTQAVGYGKTMMLFHMLRLELGDEAFVAGLRRLVEGFMYRAADWQDVRTAFETAAGGSLEAFFAQWIERVGAPVLALDAARVTETAGGHQLELVVRQVPEPPPPGGVDAPYRLRVPLAVTLAGAGQPVVDTLLVHDAVTEYRRTFEAEPLAVAIDPAFDVFRRLGRAEIPPALGELFGAAHLLFVLPAAADPERLAAYRAVAESWAHGMDDARIVTDAELDPVDPESTGDLPARGRAARVEAARKRRDGPPSLPAAFEDRTVCLFGAENRYAGWFGRGLDAFGAWRDADSLAVGGRSFPRAGRSFVAMLPHPLEPELSWGLVESDVTAAIPGLGRKLPHYRRYGFLVFQGEEPTNVHKGEWSAIGSPLVRRLGSAPEGAAPPGAGADPTAVPPAPPLIEKTLAFDTDKLLAHVRALTAPGMEGRGAGSAGLERAGDYIAAQLALLGLLPGGDDGYFQTWTHDFGAPDATSPVVHAASGPVELRNVIGILPGSRADRQEECVVVTAHYDHLGHGWPDVHTGDEGVVHPGADDNASGVAVALELARVMAAGTQPRRNIVFAFMSGEECGLLGARHYAADPVYPLDKTMAVINLDTVGRLGDGKLVVFGAHSTREMPHVLRGAGYVTGLPVEMPADDVGGSDQVAFHERGVPAVQFFTGAHLDYHRPTDTIDRLDVDGMAQIAAVVRETVDYLAGREEPLTPVVSGAGASGASAARRESGAQTGESDTRAGDGSPHGRRVALGTIPDFAFEGDGVRLDGTVPESAAQAAGLRAGDIIVRLGERQVASLRDLSEALKGHAPGDTVAVVYRRDGIEARTLATLRSR
ncbi:MAG: M20/M25/M40 family metallo-hydrolase [Candidatus Eiseniibacteriota bacterium]